MTHNELTEHFLKAAREGCLIGTFSAYTEDSWGRGISHREHVENAFIAAWEAIAKYRDETQKHLKKWIDVEHKAKAERERYERIIHEGEEEIHTLRERNRRLAQDVDLLKVAAGEEAAYRGRLRAERDAERKRCEFLHPESETPPPHRPGTILEIDPHPDLEMIGEFQGVKAYKDGLIPPGYIAMSDGHQTVLVRTTPDTSPEESGR